MVEGRDLHWLAVGCARWNKISQTGRFEQFSLQISLDISINNVEFVPDRRVGMILGA